MKRLIADADKVMRFEAKLVNDVPQDEKRRQWLQPETAGEGEPSPKQATTVGQSEPTTTTGTTGITATTATTGTTGTSQTSTAGPTVDDRSDTYRVPASGFQDAVGPGLGEQEVTRRRFFNVQLYKERPTDTLGIRGEVVTGAGFASGLRVHRIFRGSLVEKWNEMAEALGMPDWQIECGDVIVGINGLLDFHPDQYEVRTATDLHLRILRELA
eukprot:Skav231429  [mRNA]  locus=scaffold330:156470:159062:+ [translate_table: standard]